MDSGVKSSELQDRVDSLEARVKKVEKEQSDLESMIVNQASAQAEKRSVTMEKKTIVDPSNKDIQTALKNAGFYKGTIDGKIGPQTREAIMEFQKKNDLKVDGVVGRNTWDLLSEYYK